MVWVLRLGVILSFTVPLVNLWVLLAPHHGDWVLERFVSFLDLFVWNFCNFQLVVSWYRRVRGNILGNLLLHLLARLFPNHWQLIELRQNAFLFLHRRNLGACSWLLEGVQIRQNRAMLLIDLDLCSCCDLLLFLLLLLLLLLWLICLLLYLIQLEGHLFFHLLFGPFLLVFFD